MRVKWLIMGLMALALSLSLNVQAQEPEDPYQLLSEVASKTFDRIKSERSQIEQNPEILRDIMKQELLPYVDYKFAALKVLGRHFKSVPQDKLPEYIQEFRGYLITTYALAMAQYNDQVVEFEPGRNYDGEKMVTVRAVVREQGKPDINISFKVRKNSRTEEWRAFDMVAEGISMLSSKQSEFESIIRQEGIDAVIALLKEKNQQPIRLPKDENKGEA